MRDEIKISGKFAIHSSDSEFPQTFDFITRRVVGGLGNFDPPSEHFSTPHLSWPAENFNTPSHACEKKMQPPSLGEKPQPPSFDGETVSQKLSLHCLVANLELILFFIHYSKQVMIYIIQLKLSPMSLTISFDEK